MSKKMEKKLKELEERVKKLEEEVFEDEERGDRVVSVAPNSELEDPRRAAEEKARRILE